MLLFFQRFCQINDTILAKQLIQFYEQTVRVFSEIFIDLNSKKPPSRLTTLSS